MGKKAFQVIFLMLSIALLHGCALVDKHLFNPAASHARIDPLFRTADCKNYVAPNGRHWLSTLLTGSTRNMSSVAFKDACEHQARAINDDQNNTDKDRLYFKLCEADDNSPINPTNCLDYLVSKSNELCNIHKSHIYGDRAAMTVLLGTLAMGAGVAGTMTGGNVTQYLAGSAGFLTGSRAFMDSEIYRNFVTHAILKEIDENRQKFLTDLSYYRKESNDSSKIGIGTLREDALTYHNMCSFYSGLASLLNRPGDKSDIINNSAVKQLNARKDKLNEDIKALEAKISGAKDGDPKETWIDELKAKKQELAAINEALAAVVTDASKTKATTQDTSTPDSGAQKTESPGGSGAPQNNAS